MHVKSGLLAFPNYRIPRPVPGCNAAVEDTRVGKTKFLMLGRQTDGAGVTRSASVKGYFGVLRKVVETGAKIGHRYRSL